MKILDCAVGVRLPRQVGRYTFDVDRKKVASWEGSLFYLLLPSLLHLPYLVIIILTMATYLCNRVPAAVQSTPISILLELSMAQMVSGLVTPPPPGRLGERRKAGYRIHTFGK